MATVVFLQDNAGYKAYTANETRPPNLPRPEQNEKGEYIIYPGEIFCRFADEVFEDQACSYKKKYASPSNLRHHIATAHNCAIAKITGGISVPLKRDTQRWYLKHFGPPKQPETQLPNASISAVMEPASSSSHPAEKRKPSRKRPVRRTETVVISSDSE